MSLIEMDTLFVSKLLIFMLGMLLVNFGLKGYMKRSYMILNLIIGIFVSNWLLNTLMIKTNRDVSYLNMIATFFIIALLLIIVVCILLDIYIIIIKKHRYKLSVNEKRCTMY